MSAFIVPKAHIDVLVQAMINEQMIAPVNATRNGAMLWKENHKGVNIRYGERKRTPRYTFKGIEAPLDDAVVLRAASCFTYQCAEFQGYELQPGVMLADLLRTRIQTRLGLTPDTAEDFCERRAKLLGRHLWDVRDRKDAVDIEALGIQPLPV